MDIGIFGGTFNPIHNGHVEMAKHVQSICKLDKLIVIPNGISYMKTDVEDAKHRLKMVELATESIDGIEVSRIEIDRQGNSYTIDTIEELQEIDNERGEQNNYHLIIGSDSLYQMESWHRKEDLFKKCNIIVSLREGCGKDELHKQATKLNEQGAKIKIVEDDISRHRALSSTKVRNMVKNGENIQYCAHPAVAAYISIYKLYK